MPAAASMSPNSSKSLREEGLHGVAEDDRVGDLHHRGLEVDREQDVLVLGAGDLLLEEGVQLSSAHHAAVDDFARQHADGARAGRQSTPSLRGARCAASRLRSMTSDFSVERKSPAVHVRHVGLGESGDQAPMV